MNVHTTFLPLEAEIRTLLDTIKDPCSLGSGCPLGIAEMGLVVQVKIHDGDVTIGLRLTSPGCHFAALMMQEIEDQVAALPGVRTVKVQLVADYTWSEDDISASAHTRLTAVRVTRTKRLKALIQLGQENISATQ